MEQMDSVIKRDGSCEIFSFDKILNRVTRLGLNKEGKNELSINYTGLVQKIIDRLCQSKLICAPGFSEPNFKRL